MFEFLAENLSTIIIGAIVLALLVLIVIKLVRDRKNGGSCGDCTSCELCGTGGKKARTNYDICPKDIKIKRIDENERAE
ncbi:MAG: FeoB-associated Cys-rich membrane protein [Oscillospiraceae bacterium]